MTDLEAKISSEFANGDPTVQGAAPTNKPLVLRLTYKRLIPVIAALLIIGGGVTYMASQDNKPSKAPVITVQKPAEVQAATDSPSATSAASITASSTTKTSPKTAVAAKPAQVASTPATQPQQPVTPSPTRPTQTLPLVENILETVLHTVDTVIDTTLSVVL